MLGNCKLCLNERELKQSHVLPAFAGRWLKNNSLTQYFRNLENPNLRKQDLTKVPLLCINCEDRFSQWEDKAAGELFKPWNEKRSINLEYQEWLMMFVASLSWRTGILCRDEFSDSDLDKDKLAKFDRALECWRQLLLGIESSTGQYEHHIFLWSKVESVEGIDDLGKWHAYTLRGFDGACLSYRQSLLVFTHLPGMSFFSSIVPKQLSECRGTWITRQGNLTSPQTGHRIVNEWVLKRSQEIAKLELSTNQGKKISEDVSKAIASETDDNVLSGKVQAILEDLKWNW